MKRLSMLALVLLALTAAAGGDVVYMKDGKTYVGVAETVGERVRIKMKLGTIDVDKADVLVISKGPVPDETSEPDLDDPADGDATPGDAVATSGGAADSAIVPYSPQGLGRPFRPADATLPDSLVYMHMRALVGATADTAVMQQSQLDVWQAAVKDRKRRIETQWAKPEEFIRRREAHEQLADEAADIARKAYRGDPADDDAEERRERLALLRQLHAKLREAARTWADPLLRTFLIGIAELEADAPGAAERMFAECVRRAPRVAAFHQGRALALLELRREVEAVDAAVKALQLQPASKDALEFALAVFAKVPGKDIRNPTYLRARDFLSGYEKPKSSSSSSRDKVAWLAPGKEVKTREGELPELEFDRLVFRQGLGVPVGENALLVDAAALEGAEEVHVQLDARTIVPGEWKKSRSRSASGSGLAVLEVPGAKFTPVKAPPEERRRSDDEETPPEPFLKDGETATLHSTNLLQEMGSRIRTAEGRVRVKDGNVEIPMQVYPGEGAGPVLTSDNRLAGFVLGRTHPLMSRGGKHRTVPVSDVAEQIEKAAKRSSSSSYRSYSRAERKAKPVEAPGSVFLVYITVPETFEK